MRYVFGQRAPVCWVLAAFALGLSDELAACREEPPAEGSQADFPVPVPVSVPGAADPTAVKPKLSGIVQPESPAGVETPEPELPRGKSAPVIEPSASAEPGSGAPPAAASHKPTSVTARSPAASAHTSSRVTAQLASKTSAPKPQVTIVPSQPAAPPPPPAPVAVPEVIATPAPAPKASVTVPRSEHVRVEVPAGLQHWLDEDDRMRPWLGKALNVADSCYAEERADNPSAGGVISLQVTMHENARPSGTVGSVAPGIGGIVMCATTRMLGVKMPLFTGKEGESYTVRVHFDP